MKTLQLSTINIIDLLNRFGFFIVNILTKELSLNQL
jgi:hypothetical protein